MSPLSLTFSPPPPSLYSLPLQEPLLAPHIAAGLEHALRKDPHFVDGPYLPQLLALESLGSLPLPREPLPLLVLPCGVLVWRTHRASEVYSTLLPQGNGAGIFLHCLVCYREEAAEGVWVPQALFVATRWPFHATFTSVLRLFGDGDGDGPGGLGGRVEAWGHSTVQALASCFTGMPPNPGQPLFLHIREQAVHVQQAAVGDLPIAVRNPASPRPYFLPFLSVPYFREWLVEVRR
jgi:hypothetical protein